MDYKFKPTTNGREALAACLALGVAPDICRVTFGSGTVSEDTNLADVHALLEPVADGTIGSRRHKDDRFYFTIQYTNRDHKATPTFYLSEFIVFIRDPVTGEETDLLYGTLGSYKIPVPQYHETIPPSIFDLPLVLVISDEVTVEVSAPPGLVTYADLQDAVGQALLDNAATLGGGASIFSIAIPMTGWTWEPEEAEDGTFYDDQYRLRLDLPVQAARADLFPSVALSKASLETARRCGLCPTVQSMEGIVRFWSRSEPTEDMTATLALISEGGGVGTGGAGGSYVLPVASATTLGGIKIGSGISLSPDGTASVDMSALSDESVEAIAEKVMPSDEEVSAMLDEEFQPYQPEE